MSLHILEKDVKIPFPHFAVLKASAGSGKTYALTARFVQFILSGKIPGNRLRNILAITFSNNAAKEMKERILLWLKSAFFNNPEQVAELSAILSLPEETIREKSGHLIDEILNNYSDFQVRTIDSFMTTVFKASAIDFGYNPDFEILMNSDPLMEYAFDLFLRDVREGTEEARIIEEIIAIIHDYKRKEASYLWDPSSIILEEINKIYKKLAATGKSPVIREFSEEMPELRQKIKTTIENIEGIISESGIERRANSSYITMLPLVREGRFADLTGKGMKNPPVNKPGKGKAAMQVPYDHILGQWNDLAHLMNQYTSYYVQTCYMPYLKIYKRFYNTIEKIKKNKGKVFIEDINRNLAEYLSAEIVPDIYFRLGETIFHFLIDEFQDTSPVQWKNLFPLVENSLSQKGSLFVVGDTKQAVYGFRNADYTIMKSFESKSPFPSAAHMVNELDTNYRSRRGILDFNERVFKEIIPRDNDYREAGRRSGLTDYIQKTEEGKKDDGYVEIVMLERNDELCPEKQKIQDLIPELVSRGYQYSDIAVLTQKNENAVRVTTWLNEKKVPFISYSNLDIRRRKITVEVVALLNFLDSPTDDLSFATFILGDIFNTLPGVNPGSDRNRFRDFFFEHREDQPVYKSFQQEFPVLWENYFSVLFKTSGYLPLYDLATEIFNTFRLFEMFGDEEAALAKVLEVIKDFEGAGYNSIKDFLLFADDEGSESEWNMDVPKYTNAVKVMTIHKSKGLEFPVAIVLLYEDRNRGFDYIVSEEGDEICLLKLTKDTATCSPEFESAYNEERIKDTVNSLNSLYVGFTRSKEELYVIGVSGNQRRYPLDILPETDYPSSSKPDRKYVRSAEADKAFPLSHYHNKIVFQGDVKETIAVEERRRGEFIHKVLSLVEYNDEDVKKHMSGIIRELMHSTGEDYPENELHSLILDLINNSQISGYFLKKEGRVIKTECEFSDSEGNLFRMDRVIMDSHKITVIDYKTGEDKKAEPAHKTQMKNYMKILKQIWPDKDIEGIIAYVDLEDYRIIA